MKKYICLLIVGLFISESVSAEVARKWNDENCTKRGGRIVVANTLSEDKGGLCHSADECNGKDFCVAQKAMNWWSALTWCQSHGGQLANMASLCPNSQLVNDGCRGGYMCPNLKGAANFPSAQGYTGVFSRTVQGTNNAAWGVYYTGSLCLFGRTDGDRTAICE